MRVVLLLIFVSMFCQQLALATAGIAEWEIKSPGGNMISHIDPFINRYGTCIRRADKTSGIVYEDGKTIYVDHLIRWKYAQGRIAGESNKGFFLFDEKAHAVQYFPNEEGLNKKVAPFKPISRWFSPQDGWNQNMSEAMHQTVKQSGHSESEFWKARTAEASKGIEQSPSWSKLSEAQRQQIKQGIQEKMNAYKKMSKENNDLQQYIPKD